MNKFRVGRKQKRVILDENGHEVAIFNRKNTHLAQVCCDSLNKLFNEETVKLREDCSGCEYLKCLVLPNECIACDRYNNYKQSSEA